MQKILMMTTDQMIDRRILLESDALVADGWEVTILAMPGAARDHPRVVRAQARHSVSLRNRETAILSAYQSLRRHVSLNGALARRLKSFIWLNLISPHEFARQIVLPSALRYPCDVVVAHDLPILPAVMSLRPFLQFIPFCESFFDATERRPAQTNRMRASV